MRSNSLGAVFVGSRTLLIQCAERFLDRGHRISWVLSDDPSVPQWAQQRGVRSAPLDEHAVDRLSAAPFDYLFSIVQLQLLPEITTRLPRRGAVNYHDGPLPEYAGLNTPSWAILNHERCHGVSWHWITARADAGDVLKEARFPISPVETALTLNAKCHEAALATFVDLVDDLARGEVRARPQALERRRYFARYDRPATASVIDWTQSAERISDLVRALHFGPYQNDIGLPKLWLGHCFAAARRAEMLGSRSGRSPGTLLDMSPEALTVATGSEDVRLDGFASLTGDALAVTELCDLVGLAVGDRLPALSPEQAQEISCLDGAVARHEPYWTRALSGFEPLELRRTDPADRSEISSSTLQCPPVIAAGPLAGAAGDDLAAALLLFLARIGGR
jgi:methionyl-tRNA formyltransferase